MNARSLAFGAVLSLLLPIAVILIFNVRGPNTEPTLPNLWFLLMGWLVAQFVPAFCAGFMARSAGWRYGAILGCVPICVAFLAKYDVPIVFVAVLWVVAVLGGVAGQFASRGRHAL